MEKIFIEISRYLMIVFMAVYTVQCFAVFRFGNEYDRKGIYLRQNFFMVMVHFLGFASLYAQKGDIRYFRAYLIQQIGILVILFAYRFIYPRANTLIINNMCMLVTIGLLILTRISYERAMRQFYIVMGAAAVTLVVPYIISRIRFFEKFKWLYVGVGLASLAAVLLFSAVINGSKINIHIASYTFQPSEYVKIVFVFAVASILARNHRLKDIVISAAIAAAHVMMLVLSKDLGSAIIFFVVYITMLYVASKNVLYLLLGILCGAAGSVAGYKLFSHVRVRVTAFLDPMGHISEEGYQIAQSLFAIGTGGWLGMGIGQGAPSTIPVVAADFIFSAICEEMGVVFGMCLVLLCLSCFVMFMNIALKFEDPFFKLVALGLSVAYIFQVFLTVGGVVKFIPLTGVTLPLVSYGGTSVVVTFCVFAIIQGLYISKGSDNHIPKSADFKTEKLDIMELE
ncbi:MAG: FtsW/RodA/SpoVE family cell cycle protein [Lachnospiraceae bacterium]|nr:FtsW/RodA/SpoVE family cell cycle protein [Lachnospiraceae bacterium]